jgi:hypothetical protein
MRKGLTWVGIVVILGLIGSCVVGIEVFRFHECMKVGHSKLYCIINSGR